MSDSQPRAEGVPLEPSAESMRAILEAVGQRLAEFVESLPEQPAQATDDARQRVAALREPPPEQGAPLEELLALLFDEVVPCSFNTAGPGYLSYIPGGGLFSAGVAELIAAVVNRYAGVWAAAPTAVELEVGSLRWLVELMGMPSGALGVFTTGGSMSTLVALVAAREQRLGDDLTRGTLYFSEEVHHSLEKAARIAGLREQNLRAIGTDEHFRMRLDLLASATKEDRRAGLVPFFVCASAGTVNTGAVDPLAELADLCQRESLWYHVDGAYGAVFRLVDELRPVLDGIERADTLTLDPHKGLFLPYGTGVLLARDMSALRDAYHTSASYMPDFQDDQRYVDFCEVSPELSRAWRGLRLWLPFKLHGIHSFRRALAEKRQLILHAHRHLRDEPDVEIAAPPELTLFAFRQCHPGLSPAQQNQRNRELLERINDTRRLMITGTEIHGVYYLRICVLHLRTHRERVDEALEIISRELARGRE